MKRVLLRVAYDGTNYHGYQFQDNVDTIEGTLRIAIKELTGEECELVGGSRTDAGVHALDNVVVFDTSSSIPGDKFCYALNPHLPEDIRVLSSMDVDDDFHPRHRDSVKTYEYHVYNARIENPIKNRYSHFTYSKLDIEAMKKAAGLMTGEHDFSSFCAAGAQVDSKVRTIYSCEVLMKSTEEAINPNVGNDIIIRVSGNGFLYNMVRIIAGTLLEVGNGRIKPEDIVGIIDAMDRSKAGPTAPACGLTLVRYWFEE